jgi:hypothetical protein
MYAGSALDRHGRMHGDAQGVFHRATAMAYLASFLDRRQAEAYV